MPAHHRPDTKTDIASCADFVSDRTPRALRGSVLHVDLNRELAFLRTERTWHLHGHNARTLIKYEDLRTVLIILKPGTRIREHRADETVSVHVLHGRLRMHLRNVPARELATGELLAVERSLLREVEAIEESAVLMTLGWRTSLAGD